MRSNVVFSRALGRARPIGAIVLALSLTGCGGNATGAPSASGTSRPSLPPITPTPTAMPGGIFVDSTSDLGAISPFVYGTNYAPSLGGIDASLEPAVQKAKLKLISFPGGNWGDEVDLSPNQIDMFVDMSRKFGAEPRIVVRLKNGSPEKAAELVRYANVLQKYNVKYWGIGNEPDLYATNAQGDSDPYKTYDATKFAAEWRTFAQAMRKVDPSIKLVGPDISQFTGDPAPDPYTQVRADWVKTFLKANGDLVDYVSIHRYPYGDADNQATVDGLRTNSKEWDTIIPSLRQLVRAQTGKDLPVAVTEVNSSWNKAVGGDAGMDSHYNAIWFGDVLGRMIRERVDMVCQFALNSEFYAIVGPLGPWPIYNVYLMYQQFGTQLLRATSDDPLVSVFAAKRQDGTVTIMLVNLASTPVTKHLQIAGLNASSADTWQFYKDHPAAEGPATPLAGQVTLPPESMTLLIAAKQ